MNGVMTLFRFYMSRPRASSRLDGILWHPMFPSVVGTSVMTMSVPQTTVERIVDSGSVRLRTPRVLNLGQTGENRVGTTVKHPVTLPVIEKAASELWATSSRPLTCMILTSPAGSELRLITPLVLPVVRAFAPTVMVILVRVRVGVLPALLLATVIRRFLCRNLWTPLSPFLGAVLVRKLLMLVLVVTVVVASGPLFAITTAPTFTPCRLVNPLPMLDPTTLPRHIMFSMW